MPVRDHSPDWRQLLQDHATGGEACEDDVDHAVVERVYGIGPPGPHRLRRRAHASIPGVEQQD